jgi:methyl-accepting chemotaxis protein
VKSLASQTAKATDEISSQVGAMQAATTEAVQAIESIGRTISSINEITSAISAAVEEQGAATQEIARNVAQAAQGTGEVSRNVAGLTDAASTTGSVADKVLAASGDLSQTAERVRGEIETFLAGIRAG